MLIFGHDRELAQWAGERLGIADFGPCSAIGVAREGKIVAAAVYNQYQPPNVHITFVTADRRWATKEAVRAILGYPFLQLGCRRITAITNAQNEPTRIFLRRLGFKEEGYHADSFPDGDAVSYGLLKRDAERWIR